MAAELRAAGQPITIPKISGKLPDEIEAILAATRRAGFEQTGYPNIAALNPQALFIADHIATQNSQLGYDALNALFSDPDVLERVNKLPDPLYSWASLEPGYLAYQQAQGSDAGREGYRDSIRGSALDYELQRYSQLLGLESLSGIPLKPQATATFWSTCNVF